MWESFLEYTKDVKKKEMQHRLLYNIVAQIQSGFMFFPE